jgi:RHS repeat-associated protein
LKTFTEGAVSESYCYDAHGNRAMQMVTGMSGRTPQVPAGDCNAGGVGSRFPGNRWVGVTPDAAGYTVSESVAGDTWEFRWDVEGRMASAKRVSGAQTDVNSYTYDGEGKRVRKVAGSLTSLFVYDAFGGLAMEEGGSAGEATGTQYLHGDHLGSTRLTTDGNVMVARRYDYRPFGAELTSGDTAWRTTALKYGAGSDVRLKFTGKERDAETGLDYFGARYLSAAQGRFTSPDVPLLDQQPGDPQSWNLYSYVRNNPLIFTDPTGNDCVYVNSGGTGIDSINNQNTSKDCGKTGGYWVDGTVTDARFAHGSLILTGTTNGENRTSASYGLGSSPGDLSPYGQQFYNEMSQRRDASNQMIAAVAGGSAIVGAAGGAACYFYCTAVADYFGAVLTNDLAGGVIGWGKGQAGAQATKNLTTSLTRAAVEQMKRSGLTKNTVQGLLRQYENALAQGGKKLANEQLVPRAELMRKILELW